MIYSLLKFYITNNEYDNVVLGTFDGVHLGHQKVIQKAIQNNKKTLIISFDMPRKNNIFPIEDNLMLLQSINKELDVLSISLDWQTQKLTADEFITFLQKNNFKEIYVGSDYKFGYKKQGNIETLKKHFNVNIIDFYEIQNQKVSSTQIRENIVNGNILKVNELLGRNYFIKGIVIKNKQLGKTINFPTINIIPQNDMLKKGVYKSQIIVDNKKYNSITNVGVAPTAGENNKLMVETHIIDKFDEQTYGKEVKVLFNDYIREEKKFLGIEQLKEQLNKDVKQVKGEI